jgi:hypothetical protein
MAAILARLDRATGDLVSQAEAIEGKRPARGRVRAERVREPVKAALVLKNPPASNRGVKSTRRGRKSSNVRVQR